jgi:diguanylate cyclase (GGDEF)-like protein
MMAVLFVDLDDFKAVNDGMGHNAGDDLLKQVADRLRSSLRPGDTIARLGGDEFAILLEDLENDEIALELANRVVEKLLQPIHLHGLEFGVPASIGVAMRSPNSTVEGLLRDADIAMYRAKAQGKGRVVVFDDSLLDDARRHLELRVELPGALALGQFRLVYQPIQNIRGQSLYGFEALVRWDHPIRGVIAPLEFIPVAEESGFIVELGRWILREACGQAVMWNTKTGRPLSMSVNASAIQLKQPLFVQHVKDTLLETGLPPSLLTIELTESVLVEHERVEGVLTELREIGVGVAIDDFGTGYSSLQYLQRLPVSSVKIDRAFVSELSSSRDPGLVRSIVALAESLSLMTVAEGVETEDQLRLLDTLECVLAQGYFLGRPQAPSEVEQVLERLCQTIQLDRS